MAHQARPTGHMTFHEVHLPAGDVAAQRRFYAERLGLPVMATDDEVTVQIGRSRLVFAATDGEPGVAHVAFNVPENQFAEAKRWLATRAPLIADHGGRDEYPFASWDAHAVYAYDPAGTIIELIARHGLPNASMQSFGAASLLEISEVGLVVDDVPAMAEQLRADLGATPYGDGVSGEFVAVGDARALFIVVRSGRFWFPDTGLAAVPVPLLILLTDSAGRLRTLSGPPYAVAG